MGARADGDKGGAASHIPDVKCNPITSNEKYTCGRSFDNPWGGKGYRRARGPTRGRERSQ
jgi:hypothetical protein